MDEFPEFPRFVIETLRQPLEDGTITVARAAGSVSFPARFILVASQNPCPCGYASDPEHACTCSASALAHYRKKISGPLLDRIDLHLEVPRVEIDKLTSPELAEPSEKIRARVQTARIIQLARFAGTKIFTNNEMTNEHLRAFCQLDNESVNLLRGAVERLHMSARAYNRVLRVARTIADLSSSPHIQIHHLAEALQFRAKQE